MSAQIIERDGTPEYAVVPYAEYLKLLEAAEDLRDIVAFDETQERLARGEEELLSSEMVDRLLNGENPIRVWREHRGMNGAALAQAAGISAAYLSQLETHERQASVKVLSTIARVLRVNIDDLVIERDT